MTNSGAFNYQFTALRGIQAGREYYVAMCPLKLIPKIFLFDEEEIPAELRAQRVLNRARIPEIARYLVNNQEDYILSSLTASIDGDVTFEPFNNSGLGRNSGVLTVPMSSRILINDGQHRRAAIEEALREDPHIGDETVSVVFFIDAGLSRSQQMFADLNKHAVRPTKSLGILYDKRDPLSRLAIHLMQHVPVFQDLTEVEKTTISNRSTKLFTLSAIYQATKALLQADKSAKVTKKERELATQYWTLLSDVIPEWRLAATKQISAAELRRQYIHCHGVALHAMGIAGATLIATYPDTWPEQLSPLAEVDWRRANVRLWEGRAMRHGKMSKAGKSVSLTANAIKEALGLPLTAKEAELETLVEEINLARSAQW